MKTFSLADVIAFVNSMPDDALSIYHNDRPTDPTQCVMVQFFLSKGIEFNLVNFEGNIAWKYSAAEGKDDELVEVAKVLDVMGVAQNIHGPERNGNPVSFAKLKENIQKIFPNG